MGVNRKRTCHSAPADAWAFRLLLASDRRLACDEHPRGKSQSERGILAWLAFSRSPGTGPNSIQPGTRTRQGTGFRLFAEPDLELIS